MNNFIFENATKVYFGRGCVKEYLCCFVRKYGRRVLFAYGGGSIKENGIYDEVTSILMKAEAEIMEFPGIMPNPTYEKVLEGARLAKEHQADWILGVGGGSVMDCCKAVSMAAVSRKDVWENYWAKTGIIDFEPLPTGVIVTTAGTGSECNGGAVITNEKLKIKTGRDYPQCNPRFALMDPAYTYSVPIKQMVSGGFDILSHIMETYFSAPDEDNVSDDISEALMRSVIRNLRASIRNPEDYTARSNLLWASAMGENRIIKLGKKCDFQCHQMEHQLGAYTNCDHGYGLAVLQPVYYRHIYKHGMQKFVRFAENVWQIPRENITNRIDVHADHVKYTDVQLKSSAPVTYQKSDEDLAEAGIEALAEFIKEIGLPTTLQELGLESKEKLKEIADSCNLSSGSYKKMTHEEILDIFEECYE